MLITNKCIDCTNAVERKTKDTHFDFSTVLKALDDIEALSATEVHLAGRSFEDWRRKTRSGVNAVNGSSEAVCMLYQLSLVPFILSHVGIIEACVEKQRKVQKVKDMTEERGRRGERERKCHYLTKPGKPVQSW